MAGPNLPLQLTTCPCRQASRILAYLGDHLMLLTSMNLRDYLLLKVGAVQIGSCPVAI